LAVPELTRSSDIQLNERVSLRHHLRALLLHMSYEISPELCRRKADECCARAMQARSPEIRAEWLEIALEWEKLAEQLSAQQGEKRSES
jgi:hypothetical protein